MKSGVKVKANAKLKINLFIILFSFTLSFAQGESSSFFTPTSSGSNQVSSAGVSSSSVENESPISEQTSLEPSATEQPTSAVPAPEQSLSTAPAPETTSVHANSSSSEAEGSSSSSEGGIDLTELFSKPTNSRDGKSSNVTTIPDYNFVATLGLASPSRGIFSVEYIVALELFNVGVHFSDYNDNLMQLGLHALYYPMNLRYFYMFLSCDWVNGEYDREIKTSSGKYKEYVEQVDYWRTVVGIGGEALFLKHLGVYAEVGFEFFAGEGSYYLHMNKDNGYLDNDKFVIPFGIGVIFPF